MTSSNLAQSVLVVGSGEAHTKEDRSAEQPQPVQPDSGSRKLLSPLLALPAETRLQILGYLLDTSKNHERHCRSNLFIRNFKIRYTQLQDEPVLELCGFAEQAALFEKGRSVRTSTCTLQSAIFGTCKQLLVEGSMILYRRNKFLAVVTSLANFGPLVHNFGIRASWGPFQHPPPFMADGVLSHAADIEKSPKLRGLVQFFRNISWKQCHGIVCQLLQEKAIDAKTALISKKLSVAEDLYETVLFQAADVVRKEQYSVLRLIAEESQIEANQIIILAGVAAYHLALLRAKHNTTTIQDRRYAAMRCIHEGTFALRLPSLVGLEERKARLNLAMCCSFSELGMFSEAWVHAQRAMEALVPLGTPEEQKKWVEARLNDLDNAETEQYISTRPNLMAAEDWISEREQGRRGLFVAFVEQHEAEIELRLGAWLRCDGRGVLEQLVDFLEE